jgi:NAD(P)-dependent dehydrogenase (short-subunit alcohol dehydrogenase family)
MTSQITRTALVTGANQGIGFEVCRQLGRLGYKVILTGRDPGRIEKAAAAIAREGIDVLVEVLDVSSRDSVDGCAHRLESAREEVDVLVNNAGIYSAGELLSMPPEVLRGSMETNFWGAIWMARAFIPAMLRRGYGRVVNVSSGYGSFAEGLEGPPAYSLSKAALNALTVRLATEVSGNVKVNAACPGWVRTRMGGPGATLSVEKGADTIVWLATLPKTGPSGGFFRARKRIKW